MNIISTILIILVFILFCLALSYNKNKVLKAYLVFVALFLLIVFWGTRHGEQATDFPRYQLRFERLSLISWSHFFDYVNTEYVFAALMKLVSSCRLGFYAFYTFVVAICILAIYYAVSNSDGLYKIVFCSYACYLWLYFVLVSNIMRQTLAFSLCLVSIKYIFRNDFKRFVFPIILALGFHMTAILALPLWFIWDHKKNEPIKLSVAISIGVGFVFIIAFSNAILEFVSTFIPALGKYSSYLMNNDLGENKEFYLRCIELCAMLLLRRRFQKIDRRSDFFLILGFISVGACGLGFINTYTKRVGYYFQIPFHLFFFSNLPLCVKKNERYFVVFLEILYFILQAIISGTIVSYDSIIFYP